MSTRDWVEKDYYKTLGVPKDAKPDQIKKAFRKIARENHPDQHPGDKSAEQRFKEASEAHDVLSDPDKRREYDEQRSLFGSGFRPPVAAPLGKTSSAPWGTLGSATCSATSSGRPARPASVAPLAGRAAAPTSRGR